jgi:hypothetical protein
MPESTVYALTRTLFEALPDLARVHARRVSSTPVKAPATPVPLHPEPHATIANGICSGDRRLSDDARAALTRRRAVWALSPASCWSACRRWSGSRIEPSASGSEAPRGWSINDRKKR